MARNTFSSLLCLSMLLSYVGADGPQNNPPDQEEASMIPLGAEVQPSEMPAVSMVQANRINVRQIEAGGIGYGQGYTTLETFLTPVKTFDSWLPFIDLRGHHFDNGLYAFNVGLGIRYLTPSNCTIWGGSVYYDYRQTNRLNFKQIGVGLEALGAHWDYRINGYIPFGTRESGYYQARFKEFKGNNLIVNVKKKFDMAGVNAEAAYHWMPTSNIEVMGALGPYYFRGKFNKFAAGGQARIKATFLNAISVEGIGSYDNLFKWNGQGQLTFSVPLGPQLKTRSNLNCNNRSALDLSLVQPVQRFEIIVADSHKQGKVAIDPATGLPFHFIFVDNDPSSTPNGTIENPYVNLTQAQNGSSPGDIIYVFGSSIPYTPTTAPGGTLITLQNNQQLLGSGVAQTLKSNFGTISFPATIPPVLSNYIMAGTSAANSIITLANNNVISGFSFPQIDVLGPAAISANGITNATVQNNTFNFLNSNLGEEFAMNFSNCGGTISVLNNTMTCTDTGYDVAILITPSSTTPGIYNIIGNHFTGNAVVANNSTFLTYNQTGVTTTYPQQLNVMGNTIGSWTFGIVGIYKSSSALEGAFLINNNSIINQTHVGAMNGITFIITGGLCDFSFLANTLVHTDVDGIEATGSTHVTAQVNMNLFSASSLTSLSCLTISPASMCLQLNNNSFDQPASVMGSVAIPIILETPVGNTGTITEMNVTVLPPGQTCQ
jgi:hypothetical protein